MNQEEIKQQSIKELTGWYKSILADINSSENINWSFTTGTSVGLNIDTDENMYYLTARRKNQ